MNGQIGDLYYRVLAAQMLLPCLAVGAGFPGRPQRNPLMDNTFIHPIRLMTKRVLKSGHAAFGRKWFMLDHARLCVDRWSPADRHPTCMMNPATGPI